MTKDSSGHGHRDRTGLVFREKPIRHHGSNLGEFPARVGQNLQGKDVLAGGNNRKESSKIGRRNRVRDSGQIRQRSYAPNFAQSGSEFPVQNVLCSSISPITGTQNRAKGRPPDPVCGTLVADGETPASGAGCRSLPITAISNRSCASDDDNARPGIEGGFEGDLHISDNVDGCWENFGKRLADDFRQLGAGSSRTSHARMRDLRRCNSSGGTRLERGLLE